MTHAPKWKVVVLGSAAALLVAASSSYAQEGDNQLNTKVFQGLEFRSIGPSLTTGRISDLEIDPGNDSIWYLTVGSGGLWKTVNRGNTWTPIFDEYPSYSLGCVVVDPRDSNIVWLGTGENTHNRSTSYGDGVYKSTDAGATWKRVGLRDSQKIQRILIDPRDSDVVYVAAPGPLWNSGGDRGLYKTTDGGQSWTRVLHVTDDTGITDAVFHPTNPDIIYAAAYQRRRAVGQTIGGGPEAGIFKSTDAGATWERIEEGLPTVDKGRIALGVDERNPERVYALVVAQGDHGGFFRTDNGGTSWDRMSDYAGGDPQYYGEIFVDPHRPDTIWNIEVPITRSTDGGTTWERMEFDIHVDHHEIVFDDDDPMHMWIGNDGGLYETYDAGETWRHFTNLPLSQFYRVSADEARPFYTVCGGAQDNGTICGPSRTLNRVGIRTSDWFEVGGGDGFQAYFDPDSPEIVYSQSQNGSLGRLDLATGQRADIRPVKPPRQGEADDEAEPVDRGRWHWDSPLVISEHASGRIYYAGNRLYRSDDRGDTWMPVSPDLTRQLDRDAIPVMGRLWPEDAVGRHLFTTALSVITALDESPLVEGLLYVGTDDGLVHISDNGGDSWQTIDGIPGLPENSHVTDLFASRRDADTVFVTFNNFQRGDFRPWALVSEDRGQTWTDITSNLPERSGTWSIVQDHVNGDLLFVGTEFGVYFSIDGGAHWVELRGGIPRMQARDLHIQRQWTDLVVGTFGRGAYILDDYSALREVGPEVFEEEAWLFSSRPAYAFDELSQVAAAWGNETTPNPPFGAILTYYLRDTLPEDTKLVLTITGEVGEQVRRLELPADTGIQRIAWDLRHNPPPEPPADPDAPRRRRPRLGERVIPGRYVATLGLLAGETVTELGEPQSVLVAPLQR